MGLKHSKMELGTKSRNSTIPTNPEKNYEDEVVNQLRTDLMKNPEIFLLNNILMSIQFYENYEREIEEFRANQISEREIQLNRALAGHQKHCLLPDTVMEKVNERVRFKPMHGPKKLGKSEPLVPQRMFIVHDNIEVLVEGDTDDYSTVDGPVHRAVTEFASRQGYIQLRQKEFVNINGRNGTSDTDSDGENIKSPASKISNIHQNGSLPNSPIEKSLLVNGESFSPGAKHRIFERRDSSLSTPTSKDKNFFSELANGDTDRSYSDSRRSSIKEKIFRSKSVSLKSNSSQKLKKTNSAESLNKSSNQQQQEGDYDYSTLRRVTEAKPLNETRANRNPSNISSISSCCITEVRVKKIYPDVNEDFSDEEPEMLPNGRRRPPVKKKEKELFETKRYFNSVEFFKHFGDVFACIYSTLGFSDEALKNAMSQKGVINCDTEDKNMNKIYFEVIPTIATTWPTQACEWQLRQRPTIMDPTTRIMYQWPTRNMVKKILKLQANIFPFGFVSKRGENKKHALEWSLSFPAAERYMATCMSHSQVRCFFFILALYKTFMVPANPELCLQPHHIRTLIFWECERNYITWPEDRLGTKMLRVLESLYRHLAVGKLPDYFLRERNLLETCPSNDLRYSQQRLHQIIERPVVHILRALRNLRYTNGLFFPTLDFKTLYRIITVEDALTIINPALINMIQKNAEEDEEEPEETNGSKENKMNFWTRESKREDENREWNKRYRKQTEQQKREENRKKQRRASVDSIDLLVTVPNLDINRRRVLLEFFIAHFTALASKCMSYESYRYAMMILNHCRALIVLLEEEHSGDIEGRPWKEKIAALIDRCSREQQQMMNKLRESRQFSGMTYNVGDNHNVNMDNLQNSFNNISFDPTMKRKKRTANVRLAADVHHQEDRSPKRIVFDNAEALTGSSDL